MIIAMLGGIRMARVAEDATSEAAKPGLNPSRVMPSTPMRENAAASAALEPDVPAKSIVPATVAFATPPGRCPTKARPASNNIRMRPLATKSSAASTKSGIDSSV